LHKLRQVESVRKIETGLERGLKKASLQLAFSSFSVYKPTGMAIFQVVRTIWPSWRVGYSGMEDAGFYSYEGESDFFRSHDRHMNSFCFFQMILVLPVSEERAGKSLGRFVNLN
jgi:hypothetical protein